MLNEIRLKDTAILMLKSEKEITLSHLRLDQNGVIVEAVISRVDVGDVCALKYFFSH